MTAWAWNDAVLRYEMAAGDWLVTVWQDTDGLWGWVGLMPNGDPRMGCTAVFRSAEDAMRSCEGHLHRIGVLSAHDLAALIRDG